MLVNKSGWSESQGFYNFNIYVDETKTDYEIQYKDGSVSKQASPFQYVTADWNNDGDIYTMYGAWFTSNKFACNNFWTAEELVGCFIESAQNDGYRDPYKIADIPGIVLPECYQPKKSLDNVDLSVIPERHPDRKLVSQPEEMFSLDDQICSAQNRVGPHESRGDREKDHSL